MRRTAMILPALAALLLFAMAFWLYTPDRTPAALVAKYLGGPIVLREVAGTRLRVEDTGPRDAPAVILLHGFGSSLETWDGWAGPLAETHRVVRFDLPGFGLSGPDPTGDYSDERCVAIIAALMDQLGIARASLIGNSLGGRIAWRFAAALPDRTDRLVLVSPDGFASPGFAYGRKPEIPLMMRVLPYTLPDFMFRPSLAAAYGDPAALTAAIYARYRDMMLAPGVRQAILDRMAGVLLPDPEPLLRQIRAPTLLVWGERDQMIPFANAADYQRDIPNVTLVALPGLGHLPFEEAPAASLPPVRRFLDAAP